MKFLLLNFIYLKEGSKVKCAAGWRQSVALDVRLLGCQDQIKVWFWYRITFIKKTLLNSGQKDTLLSGWRTRPTHEGSDTVENEQFPIHSLSWMNWYPCHFVHWCSLDPVWLLSVAGMQFPASPAFKASLTQWNKPSILMGAEGVWLGMCMAVSER